MLTRSKSKPGPTTRSGVRTQGRSLIIPEQSQSRQRTARTSKPPRAPVAKNQNQPVPLVVYPAPEPPIIQPIQPIVQPAGPIIVQPEPGNYSPQPFAQELGQALNQGNVQNPAFAQAMAQAIAASQSPQGQENSPIVYAPIAQSQSSAQASQVAPEAVQPFVQLNAYSPGGFGGGDISPAMFGVNLPSPESPESPSPVYTPPPAMPPISPDDEPSSSDSDSDNENENKANGISPYIQGQPDDNTRFAGRNPFKNAIRKDAKFRYETADGKMITIEGVVGFPFDKYKDLLDQNGKYVPGYQAYFGARKIPPANKAFGGGRKEAAKQEDPWRVITEGGKRYIIFNTAHNKGVPLRTRVRARDQPDRYDVAHPNTEEHKAGRKSTRAREPVHHHPVFAFNNDGAPIPHAHEAKHASSYDTDHHSKKSSTKKSAPKPKRANSRSRMLKVSNKETGKTRKETKHKHKDRKQR